MNSLDYEYAWRMYGVVAVPGERVRLEGPEGREGVIAPLGSRAGHYVHVRFDGEDAEPRPCHPMSLTYLDAAERRGAQ